MDDFVFYGVMENESGNQMTAMCSDPSLCFDIVIDKDIAEDEGQVEYIYTDLVDYNVILPQHKNTYLEDKGVPFSFLSIRNEAEGEEWYRTHTNMPDCMIPYLASYHWGDLSKVKIPKKNNRKKKLPLKFSTNKGKFNVTFD